MFVQQYVVWLDVSARENREAENMIPGVSGGARVKHDNWGQTPDNNQCTCLSPGVKAQTASTTVIIITTAEPRVLAFLFFSWNCKWIV